MKVETKRERPKFRPITLTITLESKKEMNALCDIVGKSCVQALTPLWDELSDRCKEVATDA